MKVRIFGRDSDDKGSQLERLTQRLLERRGYRQIALDFVGAGGTEIDIKAELPLPGLNNESTVHVIGECKAYEATVAQPEWMKFLGKVYTASAKVTKKKAIRGIFVALSGVNGNFAGAYDQFAEHDDSVELVTGDNLVSQVIKEFKLPEVSEFLLAIGRFTKDAVASVSLGYYESWAFWIAEFANSTFAVLGGERLDQTPSGDLIQIISSQLQAATYRDLSQEEMSKLRRSFARKFVLGQCLSRRPIVPPEQENFFPFNVSVAQSDLDTACKELQGEGAVIGINGQFVLADLEANLERRAALIREMLNGAVFLIHLDTDQWESLIDEDLLNESCRIQGQVSMPQVDRQGLVQLMKWSPSGLFWSLNPDPFLSGNRIENSEVEAALAPERSRWYRSQMLTHAVQDFQGAVFGKILFERYGLVELEFTRGAVFKTQKERVLETAVTERIRIAKGAPDLGGQLVHVWLTEAQPEPWETLSSHSTLSAPASPDSIDSENN